MEVSRVSFIVETELSEIYAKVGDVVTEDQVLAEVITDKAMVEVPSPVTGKVVAIGGAAGDTIAVGSPLFTFELENAEPAASPQEETPPDNVTPLRKPNGGVQQPEATTARPRGKVLTSPSIRRLASEKGIDLTQVHGTGRSGRIIRKDIEAYMDSSNAVTGAIKRTQITEIKLAGMRKLIAQKMQASKRSIPHFSYVEEMDVTNLEELRQHLNHSRTAEQPKLSVLPFLMRALVKAVDQFPQCNSTFDEESGVIKQYSGVHIGIAAQTDKGLAVPVVKHAEAMGLWELASTMMDVSGQAKAGTASRDVLTGSTITLSSLGKLGGVVSTPVINAPEVCIVAVNKIMERPVVQDGQIIVRKMMNLSSSFDHRIVDGYDAAQMMQLIKSLIEHPATLFI
ncbi:MAG: dihydrolipoamide acetyltransferase family protein [Pseudomonadota bacterium]